MDTDSGEYSAPAWGVTPLAPLAETSTPRRGMTPTSRAMAVSSSPTRRWFTGGVIDQLTINERHDRDAGRRVVPDDLRRPAAPGELRGARLGSRAKRRRGCRQLERPERLQLHVRRVVEDYVRMPSLHEPRARAKNASWAGSRTFCPSTKTGRPAATASLNSSSRISTVASAWRTSSRSAPFGLRAAAWGPLGHQRPHAQGLTARATAARMSSNPRCTELTEIESITPA
jgi:hypothetical protein